jgi:hypothetical protein
MAGPTYQTVPAVWRHNLLPDLHNNRVCAASVRALQRIRGGKVGGVCESSNVSISVESLHFSRYVWASGVLLQPSHGRRPRHPDPEGSQGGVREAAMSGTELPGWRFC